ncbi:phage major capsid protein [Bacillus sp. ISL-7]|uniref:phage major capsid protein n=1 Tax=Bacillus sp. ISL-7 TaxID=2819136 RepID=UPI001BE7AFAD|nr:phage major capsid protein [Bacillus sp. ISL-7]MBT2738116.1 phage major capsid protein [Bacillus sp. ISL-7]
MYMKKMLLPLNLQLFAGEGAGGLSFQFQDGVNMTPEQYIEYKKMQKEAEIRGNRPVFGGGSTGVTKTAGQIFVTSEAYQNFIKNGQNHSDNVEIPSFRKELVTSTGTNGLMGANRIIGLGEAPMNMRSLLAVAPTTNNAVDYIREVGFTNASAVAPEGTLKAESSITFESETALVRTLAHWLPVTRQVVADIPQMQNHIDLRLMYGLSVTEESQILYGSGIGDNLEGLMVVANTQTYTAPAGETKTDAIRRALTRTYISGFPPTGVVLNPLDWEDIELLKGTDGHYIFLNVNTGNETRLFRVPVVLSTSMVEGSFLAGAFGLGAQLFDRERVNVRISEHHADYFTRNQLAVLCEERIALAIYRPEAFVKGTFATA